MARKLLWVREDIVLAIHHRQIAEHGGLDGMRDPKLLESALARPKNLYSYNRKKATIAALAASYAYGLARNHPFLDGNKRTAYTVCMLFLELNGLELKATKTEKYEVFNKLSSGGLTEKDFISWLSTHNTRLS